MATYQLRGGLYWKSGVTESKGGDGVPMVYGVPGESAVFLGRLTTIAKFADPTAVATFPLRIGYWASQEQPLTPLTVVFAEWDGSKLNIYWGANTTQDATITNSARYSVVPPTGESAITVQSVAWEAARVRLTLSRIPQAGAHQVTVLADTATPVSGALNLETTLNFSGKDTIAPVVTSISPAAGAAITSTQQIVFEVTDSSPFRRVLVVASYPNTNIQEVVHDGDAFGPYYVGGIREVISNGYRYTILRAGGWPAGPIITPYAIDTQGNENS